MFGIGGTEILLVFLILLLMFGPSQIPKMARGLGQALREFRKARHSNEDEVQGDKTEAREPTPDNKPVR